MKTNIKLILRKEIDSEGKSLVYLMYTYKSDKLRIKTGVRVKPSNWIVDKQLIDKDTTKENVILQKLKSDLTNLITTYFITFKVFPSLEYVRENFITEEKLKPTLNFSEIFKQFIIDKKSNGQVGTAKTYNSMFETLKKFALSQKSELCFEIIDGVFMENFKNYMITKKYANNTIDTRIRKLKAFMNYCYQNKIIQNNVKEYRHNIKMGNADRPIITLEELKLLIDKDLSSNKKYDSTRDMLVVGCLTGIRYGDLSKLNDTNIVKDLKYKAIQQNKTEERYHVPVTEELIKILEKHQYNLPIISNQKLNENIHELLSTIDEFKINMTHTTRSGSNKKENTAKRFELITFHKTRNTFITHCLQKGIPAEIVTYMTGHKSLKVFERYINKTILADAIHDKYFN